MSVLGFKSLEAIPNNVMDTVFRLCWVIYCQCIPNFFMLGFTGLFIVYLYPNFFLLEPLRDVNFTASLTQVKDLSVDLITYFTVIQTDS